MESKTSTIMKRKIVMDKQLNKVTKYINTQSTKLGVFVKSKNFSVSTANELYKETAKQTFTMFKDSMVSFQGFGLMPLDKHLNAVMQANKDNIYNISKSINAYKQDKTQKQPLQNIYVESLNNLYTCVDQIKTSLISELNDNVQLSKK